jgi:fido (protein-threonine AMPylation protein)
MPAPNEKLAAALEELRSLQQQDGSRVFSSDQLGRTARERLLKHGYVQEIMKGWLMSASPTAAPGDTTPWLASFWEFCRRYCEHRFGSEWHLSSDQSLLIHAENTTIPKQVIIHSPRAGNNRVDLLFGTSFFALRAKAMPPASQLEVKNGLRIYRIPAALTRVHEEFFTRYPIETQVVAGSVRDSSQLLVRLLEGGHATIAGRLAGLFRRLGQTVIADEIVATMRAADHDVRVVDPLEADSVVALPAPSIPPIVARLQTLWAAVRETVLSELPKAPGLPTDHDAYLETIDGVYKLDAYHSLSIEGYQVTPELVQRVAGGAWDPGSAPADKDNHDALAARGYWLAFQRVRETVRRIVTAEVDSNVVRSAHREWYRELFGPHVSAGLLRASMLAGYRNAPVYIRGSWHVPPRWELLADAMPALFDLIEHEPEPAVRAVLGHWLFGYVHPFPDGNGRVARFLMNTLLAAGGYPWTVIRVEERTQYLGALEAASAGNDVRPFARFVARQMRIRVR